MKKNLILGLLLQVLIASCTLPFLRTIVDAGKVVKPEFNIDSGTYQTSVTVNISSKTSGATIRYTTDGSNPSKSNGTVYSGSFAITQSCVLKAIAYAEDLNPSSIASINITITGVVADPVITPESGLKSGLVEVTITCATAEAKVKYTIDSTDPKTSGTAVTVTPPYTFEVNAPAVITCYAYKTDWNDSNVKYVSYSSTDQLPIPLFSHASGTYYMPVDLTIDVPDYEDAAADVRFIKSTNPDTILGVPDQNTGLRYYLDTDSPAQNIGYDSYLKIKAKAYSLGGGKIDSNTTYELQIRVYGTVEEPEFVVSDVVYSSYIDVTVDCVTSRLGAPYNSKIKVVYTRGNGSQSAPTRTTYDGIYNWADQGTNGQTGFPKEIALESGYLYKFIAYSTDTNWLVSGVIEVDLRSRESSIFDTSLWDVARFAP